MAGLGIAPYGIEFEKWANQLGFLRPDLLFPQSQDVSKWWDWAFQVYELNITGYPGIAMPSILIYPEKENWRDWAAQFVFLVT